MAKRCKGRHFILYRLELDKLEKKEAKKDSTQEIRQQEINWVSSSLISTVVLVQSALRELPRSNLVRKHGGALLPSKVEFEANLDI